MKKTGATVLLAALSLSLLVQCTPKETELPDESDNSQTTSNESESSQPDTDAPEDRVEVLEENEFYKLCCVYHGDKFNYSYEIYNSTGGVAYAEESLGKLPKFTVLNDDLLKYTLQAGTGLSTQHGYYYDCAEDAMSKIFDCIYAESDGLVCHGGEGYGIIVVEDIFDSTRYYREISDFKYELSSAIEPITSAEFTEDNSKLIVTYLTGEDYEEVTETFDLK